MTKRAPLICRNGCGTAIWFDWERKFDDLGYTNNSSKPNIPLEISETGEHLPKKHQCPNSEYAKKQQEGREADKGGEQKATVNVSSGLTKSDIEPILGYVIDTNAKQIQIHDTLYRLEKSFEELVPRFNQLVSMLGAREAQDNPLDDDGDSSRENGESPEQ